MAQMKRILVVDDEVMMTRMLKRSLEATGRYEVQALNHGARALEVCRTFMPDLVLLDVMMPDMDGGEVAAALSEDSELSAVKIVFLTAIVTKDEVPPTGADISGRTFLAKPVKTADLVACIEAQLNSEAF
jgi:two-component system, OmpR family, response regulator